MRPAALTLALSAAFGATDLQANPAGAQVIAGQASVVPTGNKLLVTTQNAPGSSHSAINWQSFSIPAGSSTYFSQPNAASTVINRVAAPNPSSILGNLGSNGHLVLVNPSGITVGAGASIDAAGFTAAAMGLTQEDAITGRLRFNAGNLGNAVSVNGSVVSRNGDVVLIAPSVLVGRDAVLSAQGGDTILAAGQQVAITGRGMEGITMQVQAPSDSALNLGSLRGDAVGIFAGTLRHSGLIQANAATLQGGRIVLKAVEALEVDGRVEARHAEGVGGQIHATAARVMLRSGAVIDASGARGGGEVLLGGGAQGQDNRLENAQALTAEAGASVRADATVLGQGGTVVLWSGGNTRTAASLSARGGPKGGNGGWIETSGHQLAVTVPADVSAPAGQGGTWLLDPYDVTIQSTAGNLDGAGFPATAATNSSTIQNTVIETALALGNSVESGVSAE